MEDQAKDRRQWDVARALVGRCLLILHTLLVTWRVAVVREESRYWLVSLGVLLIVLEGYVIIKKSDGVGWMWFYPCFAVYLVITLPLIWLLEISLLNKYLETQIVTSTVSSVAMATTSYNVTDVQNTTLVNKGHMIDLMEAVDKLIKNNDSDDAWVVVVEDTLVYAIVLGRWILPRGTLSHVELTDLLFEYLGKACDIMELFALFDVDLIKGNETISYVILAVWSISFVQFVPVMKGTKFKEENGITDRCCSCAGRGDSFPDIVATLSGLVLHDLPYLGVRLYVILELEILTFSLVFFLIKNIVVILLYIKRLRILLWKKDKAGYRGISDDNKNGGDFSRTVSSSNITYARTVSLVPSYITSSTGSVVDAFNNEDTIVALLNEETKAEFHNEETIVALLNEETKAEFHKGRHIIIKIYNEEDPLIGSPTETASSGSVDG